MEQIEYPALQGKTVEEQLQNLLRWAFEVTEKMNYILSMRGENRGG